MKLVPVVVTILVVSAGLAPAATLYSTDFNSFSVGTVSNQDGWYVTADNNRGQIVNSGDASHGLVLSVNTPTDGSAYGNGGDVGRAYSSASTLRYLTVQMDFLAKPAGTTNFWFMDNDGATLQLDSVFWETDPENGSIVYDNAQTGVTNAWAADAWQHVGIEVDQQTRAIIAFNSNGLWYAENNVVQAPDQLTRLVFRGFNNTAGPAGSLWIDNLSISDCNTPLAVVPEPDTLCLVFAAASLAALVRRRFNSGDDR